MNTNVTPKFRVRTWLAIAALVAAPLAASAAIQPVYAQDLKVMTYAAGQSAGGRANYQKSCASCHGNELEGVGAPTLTGEGFSHWIGQPVSNLFEYIKVQMPADAPGSLSDAQVATIIAFLAQENGIPVGGLPLPTNPSKLETLSFGPK